MSEHAYVHNLTHEMDIMRNSIRECAAAPRNSSGSCCNTSACGPAVVLLQRPGGHLNLLEEVNLLGAGHHGLFTADHIYSDVSFLQSQYDYWLV